MLASVTHGSRIFGRFADLQDILPGIAVNGIVRLQTSSGEKYKLSAASA
jgi:hypothetical protein